MKGCGAVSVMPYNKHIFATLDARCAWGHAWSMRWFQYGCLARNLRVKDGFKESESTLFSVFEGVCGKFGEENAIGARGIGIGGRAEGFHFLTYNQIRGPFPSLQLRERIRYDDLKAL